MRPQPELTDDIDEALLEYEIGLFDPVQLDVAWRGLCANMLADSITAFSGRNFNQCHVDCMASARRWFRGGGTVTFLQACEAVDIDPSKIVAKVNSQKRCLSPINLEENTDAYVTRGSSQAARRLVPGRPAFAADRRFRTGSITSRGGDGASPLSRVEDGDRDGRPAGRHDYEAACYERGRGVA